VRGSGLSVSGGDGVVEESRRVDMEISGSTVESIVVSVYQIPPRYTPDRGKLFYTSHIFCRIYFAVRIDDIVFGRDM
jgi:hypothetical protein